MATRSPPRRTSRIELEQAAREKDDEAPNVALAPIRWNIEKERRSRAATLGLAVDAHDARGAARRALHDADVRALEKKIDKRRRRARLRARTTAPKRFALARESAQRLRSIGRHEDADARAASARRDEENYWRAVSGVDFEAAARRRLRRVDDDFRSTEAAKDDAFAAVKVKLLGDLDSGVKRVLRSNPRTVEDELWKAAHFAKHGRAADLKMLLDARGDRCVHERDRDTAWTPLFFAARHGHLACVKLLCQRGADARAARPPGGFDQTARRL